MMMDRAGCAPIVSGGQAEEDERREIEAADRSVAVGRLVQRMLRRFLSFGWFRWRDMARSDAAFEQAVRRLCHVLQRGRRQRLRRTIRRWAAGAHAAVLVQHQRGVAVIALLLHRAHRLLAHGWRRWYRYAWLYSSDDDGHDDQDLFGSTSEDDVAA